MDLTPPSIHRRQFLTAGAALDDAATAPQLIDMARNGSDSGRLSAIELLSDMGANPAIEVGLRPLLDHQDRGWSR